MVVAETEVGRLCPLFYDGQGGGINQCIYFFNSDPYQRQLSTTCLPADYFDFVDFGPPATGKAVVMEGLDLSFTVAPPDPQDIRVRTSRCPVVNLLASQQRLKR